MSWWPKKNFTTLDMGLPGLSDHLSVSQSKSFMDVAVKDKYPQPSSLFKLETRLQQEYMIDLGTSLAKDLVG